VEAADSAWAEEEQSADERPRVRAPCRADMSEQDLTSQAAVSFAVLSQATRASPSALIHSHCGVGT